MERTDIAPSEVEHIVIGTVIQEARTSNIAREVSNTRVYMYMCDMYIVYVIMYIMYMYLIVAISHDISGNIT